jgi:hypothetical protein
MEDFSAKKKAKTPTPKPLIAGLGLLTAKAKQAPVAKPSSGTETKNKDSTFKASLSISKKPITKDKKSQVKSAPVSRVADEKSQEIVLEKVAPISKKNYWWRKYDSATHSKMLISPENPWFEQFPSFIKKFRPSKMPTEEYPPLMASDQDLSIMEKQLEIMYKHEVSLYQKELSNLGMSTDQKWLNSVIASGTWSDKIAALTLRIQESPFHNLENFDILLGIASKKEVRVVFLALEAIKDLLINNILPGHSLHFIKHYQSTLLHEKFSISVGLLIYYENELKKKIVKFVSVLEELLKANIVHYRKQSLDILSDLLLKKSEFEHKILIMIINKLGDHEGKIVTKTIDILKSIMKEMPLMKLILIKEIKSFIYSPNNKLTSVFHAIHFLLKIPLDRSYDDSQQAVPFELVECYISLFDKALTAKENGSRLLTALLSGINKTFPLLDGQHIASLMRYLDTIFKLVHTAPSFAASTQALMLLSFMTFASIEGEAKNKQSKTQQKQDNGKANVEKDHNDATTLQDRYYSALYSKLISDQVLVKNNILFYSLISFLLDDGKYKKHSFLEFVIS